MCVLPITCQPEAMRRMVEMYIANPSCLEAALTNPDDCFDLALSCLGGIAELLDIVAAHEACEKKVAHIIGGFNRTVMAYSEVLGKSLDLLSQDSHNSNWPSSTRGIKNFGSAVASYRKKRNQYDGRSADLAAEAQEALAAVGISVKNPWAKEPSNDGNTPSGIGAATGSGNGGDTEGNCAHSQDGTDGQGNDSQQSAGGQADSASPQEGNGTGTQDSNDDQQPAGGQADSAFSQEGSATGAQSGNDGQQPAGGQADSASSQEGSATGAQSGNDDQQSTGDQGNSVPPQEGKQNGKDCSGTPEDGKKRTSTNMSGKETPAKTLNVVHLPASCQGCEFYNECLKKARATDRRRVIDIEIHKVATFHYKGHVKCPLTSKTVHGKFPENVPARDQYGPILVALVVCLYTLGYMSINRIQGFLDDVVGIHMSTGTIQNFIVRAALQGLIYWNFIRAMVRQSRVCHSDETSAHLLGVGGVIRHWIHTVSTERFTYLYQSRSRGFDAIEEDGVLVDFIGVIVHDCFGSYWKLPKAAHALCGAHLARELKAAAERDPGDTWATKLLELLYEMLDRKRELLQQALDMGLKGEVGEDVEFPQCSKKELDKYFKRFTEIIKEGFARYNFPFDPKDAANWTGAANDEDGEPEGKKKRGRKAKPKSLNLLIRLRDHMMEWLQFIIDIRIPFTNNSAELALREHRVRMNISHYVRTSEGLTARLILSSITQSARKNGLSGFHAICRMLEGMSPQEFFGVEVAEEVLKNTPSRKVEPNLLDPNGRKKKASSSGEATATDSKPA